MNLYSKTVTDAIPGALCRTEALIREMHELLGSWDHVEWWFLDLVHHHRLKAGEGDAGGADDFADPDDLDGLESLGVSREEAD